MANQFLDDRDVNERFAFEVGNALPQYLRQMEDYTQERKRYDSGWSKLEAVGSDQAIGQLMFDEAILQERETPTGRLEGIDTLDVESMEDVIIKNQRGEWATIRDSLDASLAWAFQSENRATLLGRTTNAPRQDAAALSFALDQKVADEVFPIRPETQALIDKY